MTTPPTGRRWGPWKRGARKITSHSMSTKQSRWLWKQQRLHTPIHIDGTAVKVENFKFLCVHITDYLKWSTHTDSVVKKAQQRLFNLRMHIWEHPVGLYHRLVRQLQCPQPQGSPEGGAVCQTYHWGQTTCPPGHLQYPMSQEGQKDNQGHQPPEPLPVHPAIIQKANSAQVHQSWDWETEKQLLRQGHQTVK